MATEHLTGMHQDDRQLRGLSRSSSGSGGLSEIIIPSKSQHYVHNCTYIYVHTRQTTCIIGYLFDTMIWMVTIESWWPGNTNLSYSFHWTHSCFDSRSPFLLLISPVLLAAGCVFISVSCKTILDHFNSL